MIIWSHRGNPGVENSLAAFRQAWDDGIRHFETDIHLTKDKKIVLSHDPKLTRLSGMDILINEITLSELKKCRIEGKEPWCELSELLDAFPEAHYSIDLKCNEVVSPFIDFAKTRNISKWVVGSFSHRRTAKIRKAIPNIRTALTPREVLMAVVGIMPSYFLKHRLNAMVPIKFGPIPIATKRFIERCHKSKIQVFFWTINSVSQGTMLRELGADGIVTDIYLEFALNGGG